jgi:hypothetical protein
MASPYHACGPLLRPRKRPLEHILGVSEVDSVLPADLAASSRRHPRS